MKSSIDYQDYQLWDSCGKEIVLFKNKFHNYFHKLGTIDKNGNKKYDIFNKITVLDKYKNKILKINKKVVDHFWFWSNDNYNVNDNDKLVIYKNNPRDLIWFGDEQMIKRDN